MLSWVFSGGWFCNNIISKQWPIWNGKEYENLVTMFKEVNCGPPGQISSAHYSVFCQIGPIKPALIDQMKTMWTYFAQPALLGSSLMSN